MASAFCFGFHSSIGKKHARLASLTACRLGKDRMARFLNLDKLC